MNESNERLGQDLFHVEQLAADADIKLAQLQRLASVGILAGSILHEINNALTPALTYSELALSDPANAQLRQKALEKSMAGIRHATQIATATLNLVRSTGNQAAPVPVTFVAPVIRAAAESLSPLAKRGGVRVSWVCPEEISTAMHAVELQQVLINLLSNALKATLRGGCVEIKCSTWNGGGVQIEVMDDGPGVHPAIATQLFQPLVSHGGHGLGLMISRRLVEAAGGQLAHDTTYTAGARFVIMLP